MLACVPGPLLHAAGRIAGELVLGAPECGPSACALGVSDTREDLVRVVRGHARTLDDYGRPIRPTPLAPEPVFDVGSVTKVAVSTLLCLRLVERGVPLLDAPVARWLGGFAGAGKDSVAVRDLLEHRAGLWEWWPTYAEGARTPEEARELVEGLPLRYRPHAGRHYSDLGFMLLGEILTREYDAPLDEVAWREIFAPIGMERSGFRPRLGATPGTAGSAEGSSDALVATSTGDWYERRMVTSGSPYPVTVVDDAFTGWRSHTLFGEANDGNCWHAFGGIAGHAGLFTTVPDLLRLGRALLTSLDGGGPWNPDVVAQFLQPGRDRGQALGFRFRREVSPVVEHSGFPGAYVAVLPARRRVVVLLTNRLHSLGEPPSVHAAWEQLVDAVEEVRVG